MEIDRTAPRAQTAKDRLDSPFVMTFSDSLIDRWVRFFYICEKLYLSCVDNQTPDLVKPYSK